MVRGALSDDHLIQLKVVTGTLNAQKYQDKILESGVRSPLDSLDGQNMVLRDEIARLHCTRIIKEYKNQQNIASLPRPSLLLDLNPIKHMWDKLGWRVWNWEPAVSKPLWICQTLLHEWDKISCLERMYPVNLMMKMCQVVIWQCEGYTHYKPEVVDYYAPFHDFLHQILEMYAPKRKFGRNYNCGGLIVKVLLNLGLHAVFIEFCKIYG